MPIGPTSKNMVLKRAVVEDVVVQEKRLVSHTQLHSTVILIT